jgi:hypothetical protein
MKMDMLTYHWYYFFLLLSPFFMNFIGLVGCWFYVGSKVFLKFSDAKLVCVLQCQHNCFYNSLKVTGI